MTIVETDRFRRSFRTLSKLLKKKAQKQFGLFSKNLFHPSLNTEKLEPKQKNIWSFRVDRGCRVFFTFLPSSTVLMLDIGPHDIYKKILP